MSSPSRISGRTKIFATIAVFSALYAVFRIIQTIPMIGVPGARFSLSDAIAPLYGIILGPFVGGISVIIGTFLGMAMGKAPVFLGLDFLPATVNAVALGLLVRRKWTPAVLLYTVLLAAFILNPYTSFFINIPYGNGTVSVPFLWLHLVAFAVLLSPLGYKAGQWVETLKPKLLLAGIVTLAFIGTMAQHLMGNIIYEIVFGPVAGVSAAQFSTVIWPSVFFVYPWERLVLVALTVVIGVPLVRTLKRTLFRSEKATSPEGNQLR